MALLLIVLMVFSCPLAAHATPASPARPGAAGGPSAFLLPFFGNPQTKPVRHAGSLKVGKLKRHYIVYVPSGKSAENSLAGSTQKQAKPPVVIVLHGALGNAWTAQFDSDMTERACTNGFVVVYPFGTGLGSKQVLFWNAGACCALASKNNVDDVSFIRDLIAILERDYNVDPRRIYVAGASNGGMMAYRLAVELSDQIAAIGSVEGCMFPLKAEAKNPVSILEFHGTADSIIPYQGGTGHMIGYRVKNVPPVGETISYWVGHDNCCRTPRTEILNGVKRETYSGGNGGSSVCLVTIDDGGHAWPGGRCASLIGDRPSRRLSATDQMLPFFLSHPKQ